MTGRLRTRTPANVVVDIAMMTSLQILAKVGIRAVGFAQTVVSYRKAPRFFTSDPASRGRQQRLISESSEYWKTHRHSRIQLHACSCPALTELAWKAVSSFRKVKQRPKESYTKCDASHLLVKHSLSRDPKVETRFLSLSSDLGSGLGSASEQSRPFTSVTSAFTDNRITDVISGNR